MDLIQCQDICKNFGEKVALDHVSVNIPEGKIFGLLGPNGAGKTTLFRMIMGLETATSGTFEVGETVKIGYVDQLHSNIDPEKSVYETIANGTEFIRVAGREVNARAYLSKFNFAGADQEKKCKVLSGGERNRLHLALTLKSEANVLLLDEPTNDIDINTLRALEEALEDFAGCAVVISHDRWFLDRICTHILAFEGDSSVYFFEGSYSEYEENKKKRLSNALIKLQNNFSAAVKTRNQYERICFDWTPLKNRKLVEKYFHTSEPTGEAIIVEGYDRSEYCFYEELHGFNKKEESVA